MRRGMKNCWLMNGDKFMGVNLGWDFTAEHEWGIGELRKRLGVLQANADDVTVRDYKPLRGVYGLERRRCKQPIQECVALIEQKDTLNLVVMSAYNLKYWVKEDLDKFASGECNFHGKEDLVTAWKEDSFIIRVKGEENFRRVRQLHEALLKGEVAMWLGGRDLLGNSGLCFAIISEVDEENASIMRDADIDREKLEIAAEKTGIAKKIDEANDQWKQMREVESDRRCYEDAPHSYFSLKPAWKSRDRRSKHNVMFWLNPRNQDKNNYGWFTVEDLEKWLQYKGPIPKNPVPNKGRRPKRK